MKFDRVEEDDYGDSPLYYSESERLIIENLLKNDGFWNINSFLSNNQKNVILKIIQKSKRYDENKLTYEYRRKEANKHIQITEVRERIFLRDKYRCKKCKSTDNLSIDHIIPILTKDKNFRQNDLRHPDLGNLQILCRLCHHTKTRRMYK